MADDTMLAPNPGAVLQLDNDPLASYSPAQQNPPQPPPPAPQNELDALSTDPNQQPQYTPQGNELDAANQPPQPVTTPAHQDPEVQAGAAHQLAILGIAHKVASLLGGDVTHRVVKDPDGTYSVHLDDSTDKEKWGRIAAAVLGGAAHGLAVGQGPGGGAKAVAAGFEGGVNQQQQISDRATASAKSQNENLTMKANHAMQDQQLISLTYTNKMNPLKDAKEQANFDIQMANMGAEMIANPRNMKETAAYSAANPNLLNGHLGTDGSVLIPDPQADGSVKIWRVPPDQSKMKVPTDFTYMEKYLDSNGDVQEREQLIKGHTHTGAEIAAIVKGNTLAANNTIKTSMELKNTKRDTDIKDREATLKEQQEPIEEALKKAQTGQAWSEATLNKSKSEVVQNTLQQRPGGEPTEVEDPRFPPPNNFPVGTIGIAPAPKSGSAVPPTAAEAYRLKNIMQGAGGVIRQTATDNPQLFGRLQGLLSQGKTIVGLSSSKDDQAIATLAGSIQQYAQASAGFHKFRNKAAPAETEESSLNKFRNSPAAITAYLDSQAPAFKETDDLIKNYEVYHTPNGPSEERREAATRKAPNGAKFYPNPVGTPPPQQQTGGASSYNVTGGGQQPTPPTAGQLAAAGVPANAKSYRLLPNGGIEGWFDQQDGFHKLGAK